MGNERLYRDLEQAGAARPEGYDALTLSHVIEHLLEPAAHRVTAAEGALAKVEVEDGLVVPHPDFPEPVGPVTKIKPPGLLNARS